MPRPILFRCPITNELVQHQIPDEQPPTSKSLYEAMSCPRCARYHFINLATGKTFAEE